MIGNYARPTIIHARLRLKLLFFIHILYINWHTKSEIKSPLDSSCYDMFDNMCERKIIIIIICVYRIILPPPNYKLKIS